MIILIILIILLIIIRITIQNYILHSKRYLALRYYD